MSDLRELYQEVIVDHNRNPRNYREIEDPTRHSEGFNPLCGDQLDLYVNVEDDVITDVSFQGHGCAISIASASLMTELLKGKTLKEAEQVFQEFHNMLTTEEDVDTTSMGKCVVMEGVKQFPIRVKCATLAWHTLHAALEESDEVVKTE